MPQVEVERVIEVPYHGISIYNTTVLFPNNTEVRLKGGHPAGKTLTTLGIVVDNISKEQEEPVYLCKIHGEPTAVYPYYDTPYRVIPQSQLESV